MSKDIQPPPQLKTEWADGKREDSLKCLYQFAYNTAKEAIDWYWRKKWKGRTGRALRLFAILFTAAGGLVPLLLSADIENLWGFTLQSQYGYILVAFAGAFIGLDKFFGFSSTWIRYVTTATTIQTGLTKFQLEWSTVRAIMGGGEPSPEECAALIQKLLGLLTFVRDEIEKETNAWAAEYLSNLAAIEKEAKKQIEAQTPGGIDVTITNADKADSPITVSLDSAPMQTVQATTCALRPVFPGQHVVGAQTTISGKPVHASSGVVMVAAGQVAKVSLTLQ
jgi:hypothetical protein